MKKFLIFIGVLLLFAIGFVCYDYFNNDNDEIEKLDIMDSVFTINKYYTYGTRLNIEGTIDDKLNYSLVLYNGEFIRVPLILKENTYVLSEYINDGLYLDDIPFGDYYLFVSSEYTLEDGSVGYKYYSINNATTYDMTTYYSMSKYEKKVTIDFEDSYPTMMLHVEKNKDDSVYDIVIDPGHGGMDGGASAYGYSERDFTFQIAKKIQDRLISKGFKVKLTREEDQLTKNDLLDEYGIHGRAVISSEVKAKYLFSVHMNSNANHNVNGLEVYTAKNINYDFAKKLVENINTYTGLNYSINKINKVFNSIYSRNFTDIDIQNSLEDYEKKGMNAYDISTNSNYYYMIRETGGIVTGAYVDDRNENIEGKYKKVGNPYWNSNTGAESYLLELGYITNKNDLDNMINNMDKYVDAIVDTIKDL